MSPVPLIVESGKGKYVEEEEGSSHGHSDAQLRGIVPRVTREAVIGPWARVNIRLRWQSGRWGRTACAGSARARCARRPACGIGRQASGGGEKLRVKVVQVRHELQPEGHLVGTVVVAHSRFQANVQVLLFLAVELAPHHLFKAVGLGVDELGVLWHGLVGITVGTGGQGKE